MNLWSVDSASAGYLGAMLGLHGSSREVWRTNVDMVFPPPRVEGMAQLEKTDSGGCVTGPLLLQTGVIEPTTWQTSCQSSHLYTTFIYILLIGWPPWLST